MLHNSFKKTSPWCSTLYVCVCACVCSMEYVSHIKMTRMCLSCPCSMLSNHMLIGHMVFLSRVSCGLQVSAIKLVMITIVITCVEQSTPKMILDCLVSENQNQKHAS